jgi:ribosomal protein S18 acetylase RimI-like enzyme
VVEFSIQDNQLDIESFTVDPAFFRKGIAGKLLSYVLSNVEFETATVETAVVNEPAINLYEKYGFVAFKRWTPAHGIKKIALSLVKPSRT